MEHTTIYNKLCITRHQEVLLVDLGVTLPGLFK